MSDSGHTQDAPQVKGGFGGLIAIIVAIILGVGLGVFYGEQMWMAKGGPTERLAELKKIKADKTPIEAARFKAAQLRQQAEEVEKQAAQADKLGVETRATALRETAEQLRGEAELAVAQGKQEWREQLDKLADEKDQAAADAFRKKKESQIATLEKEIERVAAIEKKAQQADSGAALLVWELTDFLGDLFLQVLKLLVIPLVVTSMICGITSLGDVRRVGRVGGWTIFYYMSTAAIAVGLGILLVTTIEPGKQSDDTFAYRAEKVESKKDSSVMGTLLDVFRGKEGEEGSGMFPSNIFLAATEMNVLALIVFAIVFGAALTTLGKTGKIAIDFFVAANEAVMKMVHLVMLFAPVGIFGLVAANIAENGGGEEFGQELNRIGMYMATVIIGLLCHVLVLCMLLAIFGRRNPITYTIGILRALLTAMTTASSSATLPVTMECVEENNGVSNRAASFVLPLGATVNMDGTALYEAVAVIFIAQSMEIPLEGFQLVIIFLTATLAAIGAAGIPEAGLVTMVIVLQAAGIPLEGVGMILAIDWFLDRMRTTVNVFGDATGAGIIDRIAVEDGAETPTATAA